MAKEMVTTEHVVKALLLDTGWTYDMDDGAMVIKASGKRNVDVLIWDFELGPHWKALATFIDMLLWADKKLPKDWTIKADYEPKHAREEIQEIFADTGFTIISITAKSSMKYKFYAQTTTGELRCSSLTNATNRERDLRKRAKVKLEMLEFANPELPEKINDREIVAPGCKVEVTSIVSVTEYGLIVDDPTPPHSSAYFKVLLSIIIEPREITHPHMTMITDGDRWAHCERDYNNSCDYVCTEPPFQPNTNHQAAIRHAIKLYCQNKGWTLND